MDGTIAVLEKILVRMESVETHTTQLIGDVATTKANTDHLMAEMVVVHQRLDGVEAKTDRLVGEMVAVHQRLDGVETKTDRLVGEMVAVHQRLDGVEANTDRLVSEMVAVHQRLDGVEANTQHLMTSVKQPFTRLESVELHTTQLIRDVALVHQCVNHMTDSLGRFQRGQEVIEKRLNSHKRRIADLREEVDILAQDHH